jgi:flagellar hook-length control protein FliK
MLKEAMDHTASLRPKGKLMLAKDPPPEPTTDSDAAAWAAAQAAGMTAAPPAPPATDPPPDTDTQTDNATPAAVQPLTSTPPPQTVNTVDTALLMLPTRPTDLSPDVANRFGVGMTAEEYAAYIAATNNGEPPTPPPTQETATTGQTLAATQTPVAPQTPATTPVDSAPVTTEQPVLQEAAATRTVPATDIAAPAPAPASPPPQNTPAIPESDGQAVVQVQSATTAAETETKQATDTAPASPPPQNAPAIPESDGKVVTQVQSATVATEAETKPTTDTAPVNPPPQNAPVIPESDSKVVTQVQSTTIAAETVAKPTTAPAPASPPPQNAPAIPESDGKAVVQVQSETVAAGTEAKPTPDTAPASPPPQNTPAIPESDGKAVTQVQTDTTAAGTTDQPTADTAKSTAPANRPANATPEPQNTASTWSDKVSQAARQLADLRMAKGYQGATVPDSKANTAANTVPATETAAAPPVTGPTRTEPLTRTEQHPDRAAQPRTDKEEQPAETATAALNATPPRTSFADAVGQILHRQSAPETSPTRQIETEILKNLDAQRTEFRMQLEPAELGKIDVRLVLESGKLMVEIVSTAKTNEMLARQADSLAAALRLDNPELSSVQVVTETAQSGTAYLENALHGGDTAAGRQNSEGHHPANQTPQSQRQSETEERIGEDMLVRLGILSRTLDYSI